MYDVIAARALHVLAVVVWIGGVSMVTTVALPAVRRGELGPDHLRALRAFERRFALQARIAVIAVGLSGLYMLWRLALWERFRVAGFWWMHAMVCLWLLFSVILFVVEPIIVRRRRQRAALANPGDARQDAAAGTSDRLLAWMQRAHWVLLALSVVTVVGAVAGSHGWAIF